MRSSTWSNVFVPTNMRSKFKCCATLFYFFIFIFIHFLARWACECWRLSVAFLILHLFFVLLSSLRAKIVPGLLDYISGYLLDLQSLNSMEMSIRNLIGELKGLQTQLENIWRYPCSLLFTIKNLLIYLTDLLFFSSSLSRSPFLSFLFLSLSNHSLTRSLLCASLYLVPPH